MVWSRLKAWLFGASEPKSETEKAEGKAAEQGESTAGETYRCAVCGTEVGSPDETCPLCGSSDLNPIDEIPGESSDPVGGPEPDGERVENDGVDPAERLRETRADLLARNAERWERDGEGYRVRDADGEWHHVPDEDAVRAVLRE